MKGMEQNLLIAFILAVLVLGGGLVYVATQGAPAPQAAIGDISTGVGAADAVTVKTTNPIDGIAKTSVSGVHFGVQLEEGQVYNTTTPNDLTSQVGASDYWVGDDTTYYREKISWTTNSPGSGRDTVTFGAAMPEVYKVGTMSATSDPSTFNTTASGYQMFHNVTSSTSASGTILKEVIFEIVDPSGVITSAYASKAAGGECSVNIPASNWRDIKLELGDIAYGQPCQMKFTYNLNSGLAAGTYTATVYEYDLDGKNSISDANLKSILGTGAQDDSYTVTVVIE